MKRENLKLESDLAVLGSSIRAVRKTRKMTVAELARTTNLPVRTISRLENDPRDVELYVLIRVCVALDAKLDFDHELH